MRFIEKFTWLCVQKGISPSAACEAIGLTRSAYSRWKNEQTKPSFSTAFSIAQYFDVDVDSLLNDDLDITTVSETKPVVLGGPVQEDPAVSKQEQELLDIYRKLPLVGQMKLIQTALDLLNK